MREITDPLETVPEPTVTLDLATAAPPDSRRGPAQGLDAGEDHRLRELEALLMAALHDMKGPLMVIRGLVELLRAEPQVVVEDPDVAGDLAASTHRLQGMLDEVYQRLRTRSVEQTVRCAALPWPDLERHLVRLSRGHVHIQRAPSMKAVMADPHLLYRCLDNLVSNAMEHSSGGDVWVSFSESETSTLVEVCDDGPGIEPQERVNVFEPGRSNGRTSDLPHLGLGLYSCRTAVQAHGGSIAVTDADQGGARFLVKIPKCGPCS